MIKATNTPHNAGVSIIGDFLDFDELYEALHKVVGGENEYDSYSSARTRVLGLCYDLRHAMMGDREVEFVDNGLDEDMMKRLSVITSSKNIYLSVKAIWPEMLFICVSLNDFVAILRRKTKFSEWDRTIAAVRKLQAAVLDCLRDTLSESTAARMVKLMNSGYFSSARYTTQYVDILNSKFLAMDADKRLKNISVMAKRLFEQGQEYRECQQSVLEAARQHNCPPESISIQVDLTDDNDIVW